MKPTRSASASGGAPRYTRSMLAACAAAALLHGPAPAHAADPVPTARQAYFLALEAQSEKDFTTMANWLRKAAEGGDAKAQSLLGMVLLQDAAAYGQAFRPDACEAQAWFGRAAAQGSEAGRAYATFLYRQRRHARSPACD